MADSMRASVIIASYKEGNLLAKTIESCIESTSGLEYEIILADDASPDGSAEEAARRFPTVRLYRHPHREGVSPTRLLGSRNALGNVLIFIDGHCKPEPGSLLRLVRDVEETDGQAIITPRILALDVNRWSNVATQSGHGYGFDLDTFQSRWLPLEQLTQSPLGRGNFFESPAAIGCAMAVSRATYDEVWGFDPNMKSWGLEDLDFSLKCWLMGHPVLHDPDAGIGHRFQESFKHYSVPMEHIVVNELRTAYKTCTHAVWEAWLEMARQRHSAALPERPEGLWARAWEIFKSGEDSARQERSYLHARREHDEFWYAKRFGLSWPQLTSRGAVRALFSPFASPAPSVGPSASPPPCGVTGITPALTIIFLGQLQKFTAQGNNLVSVNWSAPNAVTPSGTGPSLTTKWNVVGNQSITASCGATSKNLALTVVAVNGVLTADDNFAGRSKTNFGVAELIHLSFTSSPSRTAAQLGGLRWVQASGPAGTLSNNTGNGNADFIAPATPGSVGLQLVVVSGPNAGGVVFRTTITVIAPSDAVMIQEPGTSLRHTSGQWGITFYGHIFLRPTNVSFHRITMNEGGGPTVTAVSSGFLTPLDSPAHAVGADVPVGPGNLANGCQVLGVDTVGHIDLPGPFSVGDFLWAIPWQFKVGGGASTTFTTANHHTTADAAGTATISKKSTTFTRAVGDPTVPTITSITPATGPVAGGTLVTINGTGLSHPNRATFGGVASPTLPPTSVNDTQVTAASPAGAVGAVDVVVTAYGPLNSPTPTSPADQFTYA
jgi:glycosyltransferase involved in cell wall biosynthesis